MHIKRMNTFGKFTNANQRKWYW